MIGIESFEGIQPALNLEERLYFPLLWSELVAVVEPEAVSDSSAFLILTKGDFGRPFIPGGKESFGDISEPCGVVEIILDVWVGFSPLVEVGVLILIH